MQSISAEICGGYAFKDCSLLKEALTHRSYSSEKGLAYDNQRLEFLGDAVLQLVISEYVFMRYKDCREGFMSEMRSALVRQKALADLARETGLGRHLMLGRGEMHSLGHGSPGIMSDAFEALIGAVYLDGGLDAARGVLLPILERRMAGAEKVLLEQNPKGLLQEYTQREFKDKPSYRIVKTEGPDHRRTFLVSVSFRGEVIGTASGSSRKSAESAAAAEALKFLRAGKAAMPPES